MLRYLLIFVSLLFPLDALDLTLVTYNVRYEATEDGAWRAWPARLHRLVQSVRTMNPDVMGVQEALHGQVCDLRLSLPDYEFFGVGRDDAKTKGEYSGVFYRKSRFRADLSDAGTFWLSDTPEKPGSKTWGNEIPRITTWLHLIEINTQRGFTIFNTHWDHRNQPSREKAALLIAKRIEERRYKNEPAALIGDFNATEDNLAVAYLSGRSKKWSNPLIDTYATLHPNNRNRRTLHFWSNDRRGSAKVDHILCSPPCDIRSAQIICPAAGAHPPSDHFPVLAKIRWP